jgi:hypothetical protein
MNRKKLQYGQVISGHVDYTPEGLSKAYERHITNLLNTEAIRKEAYELEAAPFDGDQKYRADLLNKTDQVLQQISQGGAFGNMSNFTGAVNRTATEYQKRANPITQNKTAWDTYKESLDKQLEEGTIDNEDYQGALTLSTYGYEGLKVDENGRATNFFEGVNTVANPEINKMIKEALSNMKTDSNTTVQQLLGQGPGNMYKVRTEAGIEYISRDRVEQAMRMVMEDPRVTAYIGRKAQIRTEFLSKDQLVDEFAGEEGIINTLKTQAEEVDRLIADSDSDEQKQAYTMQKNELVQNIGKLEELVESGNEDKMRDELRMIKANQITSMYDQSAKSIYSFTRTTDKNELDWDPLFLQKDRQAHQWAMQRDQQKFDTLASLTPITYEGNIVQYDNPYGANNLEAAEKRTSLVDIYNDAVKQLERLPDNASPDLVESYVADVRRAQSEIKALDDYTLFRYGNTNPNVLKTEEYLALDAKVKEAESNFLRAADANGAVGLTGSFWIDLFSEESDVIVALENARRERLEYVQQNAQDDPLGGQVETAFSYSNAQGLPMFRTGDQDLANVAKGIDASLDTFFEAVPDYLEIYIPGKGGSGALVSYGEATGKIDPSSDRNTLITDDNKIPADAKTTSVGISLQAPHAFLGSTLQVNYTSEETGRSGSYLVPLNKTINIPALAQHFNTPDMKFYTEVERYGAGNVVGMTRAIPYSSTNGPGKVIITYTEKGPEAQFVAANGIESSRQSVYDPKFREALINNQIQI